MPTRAAFCRYESWRHSFENWAKRLSTLPLYAHAAAKLRRPTTEEGIRLMAKNWATDPAYAEKVIRLYREIKSQEGIA